jgi:hypothetical protein
MKLSPLISILIPATSAAQQVLNAFGEPSYGVDVSFPVHHISFAQDQPLGDRQKLYDDFMAGCRRHYSGNSQACDITEEDRVEMSVRQPASMQVRVHVCIVDDVISPVLTASFPELHVYWFQEGSGTRQCLRSSFKLLEYALRSEGAREMVQRKHVCQQLEGTNIHGQRRRNIAAWWRTKP